MIDRGGGEPIVVVPGIQGRWEWMEPAVEALATRYRVVTESLPGEPGSSTLRPGARIDAFVDWLADLIERTGVPQPALCGISYGGLVTLRYAAAHPSRVACLVLVSTPSPAWTPNRRVERYLRAPRLMSPLFALSSPIRLLPEILKALPGLGDRARFAAQYLYRIVRFPFAPSRMATRIRLLNGVDFADDCRHVQCPTLVVTGSVGLDRVVPTDNTREYLRRIPGALHAELSDTGHIGLVTKPAQFATIVGEFVTKHAAHRGVSVPA